MKATDLKLLEIATLFLNVVTPCQSPITGEGIMPQALEYIGKSGCGFESCYSGIFNAPFASLMQDHSRPFHYESNVTGWVASLI